MLSTKLKAPLRSLIAVAIGFAFFKLLNVKFTSWILISVIVMLPTTTGATVSKALKRVTGTCFGVLFGLLLIAIFPDKLWVYLCLIFISFFFAVYTSKIDYVWSMFSSGVLLVVALIHFLGKGQLDTGWAFAIARTVDTIIGAAIVIIVGLVFWPEKSGENLKATTKSSLKLIYTCMENILQHYAGNCTQTKLSEDMATFYRQLLNLAQLAEEVKQLPGEVDAHSMYMEEIIMNLNHVHNNLLTLQVNYPDFSQQTMDKQLIIKALGNFAQQLKTCKTEYMQLLDCDMSQSSATLEIINQQFLLMINAVRKLESGEDGTYFADSPAITSLLVNFRNVFLSMGFIFVAYSKFTD